MKRILAVLFGTLVFAVFGTASAFGQSELEVKAEVPFSFYVENTLLPPGNYVFSWVGEDHMALSIRNDKTGTGVEFLIEKNKTLTPRAQSSLVFDLASGKQFLSEVWKAGSDYGWKVIPSRKEKQALKASGNQFSQRTILGQRG